jgi:uncharacterized protein (TIGR04255 family)
LSSKAQSGVESLPDFSNPPAVETLLGVHFKPLSGWTIPYFGLFWNEIRSEYPKVEVHPPLPSEMALRVEVDPKRTSFQVVSDIPVRCWFIHKSETRLVQIQSSAFIQNWRKLSPISPYLHYDDLRPSFVEMWRVFREFLRKNVVGEPIVTECEVTYINHIDRGRDWDRFAELPEITPTWAGLTSYRFLPPPLSVSIDAFYPIGDNGGRLEITLQPGVRKDDGTETIQLVLTARCKPRSIETEELMRCLDLGREWVVRGFTDFTSPRLHKIWGIKERTGRK